MRRKARAVVNLIAGPAIIVTGFMGVIPFYSTTAQFAFIGAGVFSTSWAVYDLFIAK